MYKLFIPKENSELESRIAATPTSVKKLSALGFSVCIEDGLGSALGWSNTDYSTAGASIESSVEEAFATSDCVLRVSPPAVEKISSLKSHSWHISFIDPFFEKETLHQMLNNQIKVISMHLIPRTTVAQPMDALSSQSNLDGYASVIVAARESSCVFPMMTTAAGTVFPAKILILGVGVAGLQAIATAKRLGAHVEAYDTRPHVAEQVESLGAKFLSLSSKFSEERAGGYAKQQSAEELKKQQESLGSELHRFDVVITTAKVFGSTPPILLTQDMLSQMKNGSLVIDLASELGGNVEGSRSGEMQIESGVKILGYKASLHSFAKPSSELYAMNLYHLLKYLWNSEEKNFDENKNREFLSQISPKIEKESVFDNE